MLGYTHNNDLLMIYSLLSLTIYVYSIFFFFLILFTFNVNKLKNIYNLNKLGFSKVFYILSISSILSIAGVPPFIGFFNKLILFLIFFKNGVNLTLLLFIIINIITLYFYLRILRFTVSKKNNNNVFNYKNFNIYINIKYLYIVVTLAYFNIFFIFFFNDMISIYVYNLITFI